MHINLILESEARSASVIPLKLLVRLVLGAVFALMLLGVFSLYTSYTSAQQEFLRAQDEWKKTMPRYEAAIERRTELSRKNGVLKEIAGWRASRIEWHRQLDGLRDVVPATVQLTELRVSQMVLSGSDNVAARAFEMRLAGRSPAVAAEESVSQLRQSLLTAPVFTGRVEAVNLPPGAFRQAPAGRSDRIFELVCKYGQRRFE